MSTKKKPKKFRTPNVPLATSPATAVPQRVEAPANSGASRAQFEFDYTHITNDLRRIGILAGSIIAIMVALSFFIK